MDSAQTPETPSPTSAPEYKTVVIDPDGDLSLQVSTDDASKVWTFRVCSAALRRRSRVWKQMLFGPWKEAKPASSDEDWIVELFDDCPQAMQLILHIVHGNFDMVPPLLLSLHQLHNLLVVAKKYDIVNIIKPWCQKWSSIAQAFVLNAENIVMSFFVAWELGDESLFVRRLQDIAVHSAIDEKGRLVLKKDGGAMFGRRLTEVVLEDVEHLGPQDILETISQIRTKLITSIVEPVHDDLEARLEDLPACSFKPSSDMPDQLAGSARLCDAAILGGIHSGMLKGRGYLLPKQDTAILDSVVSLGTWLFPVLTEVETLKEHGKTCSITTKYIDRRKAIHGSIPGVIQRHMDMKPSYKSCMEKARAKTGFVRIETDTYTYAYWPGCHNTLVSPPTPSIFTTAIRSPAPATVTSSTTSTTSTPSLFTSTPSLFTPTPSLFTPTPSSFGTSRPN